MLSPNDSGAAFQLYPKSSLTSTLSACPLVTCSMFAFPHPTGTEASKQQDGANL